MQASHYSTPAVTRSRPSYGPMIFGSFFLWGGVAGILHDTTTMGLGPSLTIALSATGFAVAVLTLLPRFSNTEPAVAEPASQSQSAQSQTVQRPAAAQPQTRSESEQQSTAQTAVQDGSIEVEEDDETAEMSQVSDANEADEQADPWDADQGWASDIRW